MAGACWSTPDRASLETDTTVRVDGEIAVADSGDHGHGKLPMRDAWASVELWGGTDQQANIRVTGFWYEDEDPQVELATITDYAMVTTTVSPERARELAADLETAADHASSGGE